MSSELKKVLIIGGIIVAVVVVLIVVAKYAASTKPTPTEALLRDNSHYSGSAEAAATLIEFGDFQCPACGQAEPVISQIRQEYGDRLKFVYRNFPLSFHQHAPLAAQAAEAAALQSKFWEMHDLLYANQATWSAMSDPTEQFKSYAQQLSLDVAKFSNDLTSQAVKDTVKADQRDGEALGISGTPTFYLNGKKLDSWSHDQLKQEIDQILNQAQTQASSSATPTP